MIEMTIESVRINLATQQRVAILKAKTQERHLFIWIAQPVIPVHRLRPRSGHQIFYRPALSGSGTSSGERAMEPV